MDGTSVAFTRSGDGPPLILIGGRGLPARLVAEHPACRGASTKPCGPHLLGSGLGESRDRSPCAVEREVEDLNTVPDEAELSSSTRPRRRFRPTSPRN